MIHKRHFEFLEREYQTLLKVKVYSYFGGCLGIVCMFCRTHSSSMKGLLKHNEHNNNKMQVSNS